MLHSTADASKGTGVGTETSVVTCGADGTIRVWGLNEGEGSGAGSQAPAGSGGQGSTVNYARRCATLRGVLLADVAEALKNEPKHESHSITPETPIRPKQVAAAQGHGLGTGSTQLRCVRVSRDGHYLATGGWRWGSLAQVCTGCGVEKSRIEILHVTGHSWEGQQSILSLVWGRSECTAFTLLLCVCTGTGDVSGNVRVYDTQSLSLVAFKEAHDSEVLSLDFSDPSLGTAGENTPCLARM